MNIFKLYVRGSSENDQSHDLEEYPDRMRVNQPSPYFFRRSTPWAENDTSDPSEFTAEMDEQEHVLREYWWIIKRYRWLVLSLAFASLLLSALYTFTRTPLFIAKTSVLIERRSPQVLNVHDARSEASNFDYYNEFYKNQYQILSSPALAERVIRDEGLQNQPLFVNGKKEEKVGLVAGFWGSLKRWAKSYLPIAETLPAPRGGKLVDGSATDPGGLTGRYLSMLSVKPISGTGVVEIAVTTPDPAVSARLANAHVDSYLRYRIDIRSEANEEATKFLQKKLLELKSRVEESELSLNHYRRDKGIISLDDKQNVVVDRLFDLNKTVTAAETDKIALEAQVHAIRRRDYDTLPVILNSPVIQALKGEVAKLEAEHASLSKEFKPGYAPLDAVKARIDETRRRLNVELQNELKGVESAYVVAQAKEAALRARMNQQKGAILSLKDAGVQYAILAREVESNRQLYDSVLQRMKEMAVASEIRASNTLVMAKARPPLGPSYPDNRRNLLFGFLLGIAGGIALAFLLARLDNAFKSPEEAERYVGLPSLGVVPDFSQLAETSYARLAGLVGLDKSNLPDAPSATADRQLVIVQNPMSVIAEAFRSLRSSLLLCQAGQPPHTLVLTSATRDEGKTTTLINTAIAFAQMDVRVLVIDADLRRPRCHKVLKMENGVGLTEVLTGGMPWQTVIKATPVDNLFLMTSGSTAPNPAELVGSRKMRQTLDQLREHYQFIFIDSSPVMAVTDPVLLSTIADGVLLVVNGKTPKQIVRKACARLRAAHAKILGVLLNQIDTSTNGYSSYYRYYYEYYGSETAKKA